MCPKSQRPLLGVPDRTGLLRECGDLGIPLIRMGRTLAMPVRQQRTSGHFSICESAQETDGMQVRHH